MPFPHTESAVSKAVFDELQSERPGRLAALEDFLAIADEVGVADAKAALLQAWHVMLAREANASTTRVVAPVLRIVR